MTNKYSVACITLVRDKYKINTDGICVVYTADSIRDSIRTQKNDSQVPTNKGRIGFVQDETEMLLKLSETEGMEEARWGPISRDCVEVK